MLTILLRIIYNFNINDLMVICRAVFRGIHNYANLANKRGNQ